ncbi:sulfate/molybdate ABC transporter ATP-binding protein [Marinobacter sp. X15-166B]|uniref:sulfate/molybdate ABC transporter ATP-binding protein n=1 Tax=Marinobacter sp. X15-166B TaxID=1897620 RepID=UPI00085C69BD|nr:TOBE-like domain-containing protein [Marinobacter sp. X15-166B]OEY65333.1 sulfate ABC transporter ATP-binding protein [Marinobacter sp. X15-166B]
MGIDINGINKFFGSFQALHDINLSLPDGQITGLLGPSGSGKTTLLRIIAGLETAEQGSIWFQGRDVTRLHVRDRRVGFVFQHYALFRHMTVARNIAFGLEVLPRKQRPGKAEIKQRVGNLLEMVQLSHLADRYPSQLSGGQKQRIALARAMAMEPEILLLDEPFGALDAQVRKDLRRWLRNLHDELNFTSVFVTHDQEEALELSDQVVVMSHGRVEQVNSPLDLYASPDSRFVFDFLGQVNVLSGTISNNRLRQGKAHLTLPEAVANGNGQIYLRPHEVRLAQAPTADAHLPVCIESISVIGAEVRIELKPQGWLADEVWEVGISHGEFNAWQPQRGDVCYAVPDVGHFFLGDEDSPRTLSWLNRMPPTGVDSPRASGM